LKALVEARSAFRAHEDHLIGLIVAGKTGEGRDCLVREMLPLQTTYLAAIEAFARTQVDGIEQFGAEAADMAHGATVLMIALAAIATSLAAVVAATLTRSVTVPIANAVRVAQAVASGDLSSEIEVRGSDETGQLLSALKTMNQSLVGIVRQVRQSSSSIAAGSAQIASDNADFSRRTEGQASNLQQTAASMEQITETIKPRRSRGSSARSSWAAGSGARLRSCDAARDGRRHLPQCRAGAKSRTFAHVRRHHPPRGAEVGAGRGAVGQRRAGLERRVPALLSLHRARCLGAGHRSLHHRALPRRPDAHGTALRRAVDTHRLQAG